MSEIRDERRRSRRDVRDERQVRCTGDPRETIGRRTRPRTPRLSQREATPRAANCVRIAYLCEFPTLLGGERSLLVFLDACRAQHDASPGLEPLVVAPDGGQLARELEARGIERLAWPPGGKRDPARLAALLRDRELDLVHGNSLLTADATHAISRALGIPGAVHVRDILGISPARVARLSELECVLGVSTAVTGWLAEQGVRATTVTNAVDVTSLRDASRGPSLRDELGLPATERLVGCIGQIALRKGQDLFLEAARELAPRAPRTSFLVVGERYSRKDESRDFEERLRDIASRAPLAGQVHFLGHREDIARILSQLDLVVVPSRQEPLSRVLLEALALGIPTLATAVGGSGEILEHGRHGTLCAPDHAALAEAMERSLLDEARRATLATRGPERAKDFSPTRQAREILGIYRALLENAPPR